MQRWTIADGVLFVHGSQILHVNQQDSADGGPVAVRSMTDGIAKREELKHGKQNDE